MNILIRDTETGTVLFGHTVLKQIQRTKQAQTIKIYTLPAEAWIAFLRVHYSGHNEVREYLRQVDETHSINPSEGKFLDAVDEILDISIEQANWLQKLVNGDSTDHTISGE